MRDIGNDFVLFPTCTPFVFQNLQNVVHFVPPLPRKVAVGLDLQFFKIHREMPVIQ